MKIGFAALPLLVLLAACTSTSQVAQTAPPATPSLPPPPLRPSAPLTPPEEARPLTPPPVRSAGALTLTGIGTYMDTQENELRASLRGTGALVMRPGDDLVVVLRSDMLFNGAQISPMAETVLDGMASVLRRFDRTSIQVQGFTDTRGAPDRNLALSDMRAKAVQAALAAAGVPRNRISARGFGETRLRILTGDNVPEPRNQRVEIRIIARPGG